MKIAYPLVILLALSANSTASHSQSSTAAQAQQINASNAAQMIQGGPDAIGGIGDWFLSNGTICAIISDVEHESEFSTKGGVLVDLGYCDRDDDHYTQHQDLIDGKRDRQLNAVSIHSESSDSNASVIVNLHENGIEQTTRYRLSLDTPTQLHISKTLKRIHDTENEFNVYSAMNFNYHSLEPFVFSSKDLTQSTGFKHEDFVSRGINALPSAARNADTIITISPPNATTSVAYGWQMKSVTRISDNGKLELPSFALADDSSNAFLIVPDTFYIGDGSEIGWLQLIQIPLLSLDTNDTLEIEEVIYVGKNGDVASITDQLIQKPVSIIGQLGDANSALHIDLADGTPITQIRPQKSGTFSAKLPKGDYVLRHLGSANRQKQTTITLAENTNDIGVLKLPESGKLILPNGQPMRLVIKGINGTQDPNFIDTFSDIEIAGKETDSYHKQQSPQVFLAGVIGDKRKIELAAGDYQIYATRGPEYSLEKTQISIANGQTLKLDIKPPKHLLPTPNHIASDLHVHSGLSFDNAFSEKERVRTFVAEHGEVMVPSEHDVPVDYTPLIEQMGVADKIKSIAATEITSLLSTERLPFTGGHVNVFPYQPRHKHYRRGMVNHESRRLREVIHDVRQIESDAIFQLNHPRTDLSLSGDLPDDHEALIDTAHYLEHMGVAGFPYNPEKPLHSHPNNTLIDKDPETGLRDIDFDLIELINPGGEKHEERLQAVRKDWLSFLKQGEKIVATANSDSHTAVNQVAVPRTMVAMQDDQISNFDQTAFFKALKSGNAYGTTGPMIELDLSGKQMGETHLGNQANLSLKIASVDWIDTQTAKIQINGETIKEYSLDQNIKNGVNNHQINLKMSFEEDAFVTIEIYGKANSDYQVIYPEITPYAFSNAIYVDANKDGVWDAPGL